MLETRRFALLRGTDEHLMAAALWGASLFCPAER